MTEGKSLISPYEAYKHLLHHSPIAQLVEHGAVNTGVVRSRRTGGVGRVGNVRIFQNKNPGQTLEVFSSAICGLLITGEIRFGILIDNQNLMGYDCL